jgi:hypothetical protein
MTRRQEEVPKSPIEKATEDALRAFNGAITYQHHQHGVTVPEKEFRRIVASFLERRTMAEMCELLHTSENWKEGE